MTENEAQKWLEKFEWDDSEETSEALATICEALQEYPKFRAIGTVKEIKIREAQFARLSEGYLNDLTLLREYQAIGTVEELKTLKKEVELYRNLDKTNFSDGYAKAIDEFAEALKADVMATTFGLDCRDVDRIAKEMKAGVENE